MKKLKYRFGEKLRNLREKKGITLKAVAEIAGVSESLISQIERNKVSPSIDTLFAIADALQIELDYLFADLQRQRKVTIVKKAKRPSVLLEGINYHQLTVLPGSTDKYAIEAFILEIPPGISKGHEEFGHTGKELGFIMSGTGELQYGKEVFPFEEGDSVSFSSDLPHIIRNTGEETLKALWVITPPKILFYNQTEESSEV
ncbi:helix-turn-helix domain-containing protein [Spirochaeta cellobiosiphila]|uniref:helix-turn-helix domain-containing protein n=1 Tax=Spirochaeta cellobiosiphila TaxID=504483 RepID=UPI0004138E32|nr:XRE family transcriptional regulator [Spirochaeta cellobiosiphila]